MLKLERRLPVQIQFSTSSYDVFALRGFVNLVKVVHVEWYTL